MLKRMAHFEDLQKQKSQFQKWSMGFIEFNYISAVAYWIETLGFIQITKYLFWSNFH